MTRNWKTFGLQTVLAAALTAAPAAPAAAGEEKDGLKDLTKRVETIEDGLKKIQETVDADSLKIGAIDGRVKELEGRMKKLEDAMGRLEKAVLDALEKRPSKPPDTGLDAINARLDRIAEIVERLVKDRERRLYPPAAGRILLANNYAEEMLFVINRVTYRLAPGSSRLLDAVPTGTFTYEIISPTWGSRARRTTTLAAGETVRLTVD
jgi:hypothetical protein